MKAIQDYLNGRPGFSGAVLVSREGKIEYQEAFGWADKENGVKNDTQTKYCVGSMLGKPFTAVCIMQLMEKGHLKLSDPIETFFPHYTGTSITIHHLLNHTSGIENYLFLRKKIKWDQDFTPQQIMEVVEQEKVKFTPGKKSSYSNTNYLMLGMIIEAITGMKYEQYVREHVLEPAGMMNTGFIRDGLDGVATNYINHKRGFHLSPTLLFACGEVVSTVEDALRFDRAFKQGLLVSKETRQLMEEPSYTGRFVTMGTGWVIKNLFERKSICHGGSHPGGYTSHLERYIDEDITIIVLSNHLTSYSKLSIKDLGGTLINREIASIVFEDKLQFYQKII
ncbi:serine hydrolase domain-containing protein [Cytobacillus sp. FJAT-54145]|uniref:Serine hydrolase domain-containing protein n=1 Tax=Cytobacillus spartinae TaxID=3299023 RepID=A0ABW6KC99_9BACI